MLFLNHKRSIMFLICIFSFVFSMLSFADPMPIEQINVVIDGERYVMQETFYNDAGNLVAPVRELLEIFGANVNWNAAERVVVANNNDIEIKIFIDSNIIKLNGEIISLDVMPRTINGKIYVPLRFIAESFGYHAEWNGQEKTVTFSKFKKTKLPNYRKNAILSDKTYMYCNSAFFDQDYLCMQLSSSNELNLSGRIKTPKKAWMFHLVTVDKAGNKKVIIEKYADLKSNNFFGKFDLKADVPVGEYEVIVYFQENELDLYWSVYEDIKLIKTNTGIYFKQSPIYAHNYKKYIENANINPKDYLQVKISNSKDKKKVADLAQQIVINATNDYQKLEKINNWVADNIYYDWDSYLGRNDANANAISALDSKRSVCKGYAELTNAMLRSVGIPTRIVVGYALGVNSKTSDWSKVNSNKGNHAWNEAYIDGRWVIVDITWNSNNIYRGGKFQAKTRDYRYFDADLQAFSIDHKIIRYLK